MADEFRRLTDERTRDDAARVALIERSILMLLVVGHLIGVLAIVKPFTTAILFGASLATAAWPIRQALVRRGLGHGPAFVELALAAGAQAAVVDALSDRLEARAVPDLQHRARPQ